MRRSLEKTNERVMHMPHKAQRRKIDRRFELQTEETWACGHNEIEALASAIDDTRIWLAAPRIDSRGLTVKRETT